MNARLLQASHSSRRPAVWNCGWLLAATMTVIVAGCTVGPDYQQPGSATLDEWGELAAGNVGPSATRSTTRPSSAPPIVRWWTVFGDQQLDSLIDRAVRGNLDRGVLICRRHNLNTGVTFAARAPEPHHRTG